MDHTPHRVAERGPDLTPFDEAQQRIRAAVQLTKADEVPLDEAPGRVLVGDVMAAWDLPPADNSAMDGYAIRAADVASASEDEPVELALVGTAYAGHPSGRSLREGQAFRITTGGVMPQGADAVVRQERVEADADLLRVTAPVPAGADLRRRGEDVQAGSLLLEDGRFLGPHDIGLLAAFGHATVPVRRRPRVLVLATGDELVAIEAAAPGLIVESNSHVLMAMARAAGADVRRLGIAPDEPATVAAMLAEAAADADFLVTAGGASVGDRDPIAGALDILGVDLIFRRVAMRPGKPVWFGRLGGTLLFALPGNPAAAALTFEVLVRPAILQAGGRNGPARLLVTGRLEGSLTGGVGMTSFMHASVRREGRDLAVSLPPRQGSSRLAVAPGANALLRVDSGARLEEGDPVEVALVRGGPSVEQGAPTPPVIGFVGPSGSGKTTLLERLIPRLVAAGLRVQAVKRTCHKLAVDKPGKDSWRLRQAGAAAVALASPGSVAVMSSEPGEVTLAALVDRLSGPADLVLAEGFKRDPGPRIEVHSSGHPFLHQAPGAAGFLAVVSDDPPVEGSLPAFHRDAVDDLAEFVLGVIRP